MKEMGIIFNIIDYSSDNLKAWKPVELAKITTMNGTSGVYYNFKRSKQNLRKVVTGFFSSYFTFCSSAVRIAPQMFKTGMLSIYL